MIEPGKWEDVYALWERGAYSYPKALNEPVSVETILMEAPPGSEIFGYDWLSIEEVDERRQLIEKNPLQFLYLTPPSHKGTIHTAQMLAEAQSEEELAAIWIAATAQELAERTHGSAYNQTFALHAAACSFLAPRFFLWHHSMKRLVPELMIPWSVLESLTCEDARPVMGLIQMNTLLLKSSWRILRYSSQAGAAPPDESGLRRKETRLPHA